MVTDKTSFLYIAKTMAEKNGLPIAIVPAICEVESGWNTYAMRYEPAFAARYINGRNVAHPREGCSRLTEELGLATSWGLMQVMGQTARELGFDGPYLAELCEPDVGMTYGCLLLAQKMKLYHRDYGLGGVIAAYNAGSPRMDRNGQWINQPYVNKVMAAIHKYS